MNFLFPVGYLSIFIILFHKVFNLQLVDVLHTTTNIKERNNQLKIFRILFYVLNYNRCLHS